MEQYYENGPWQESNGQNRKQKNDQTGFGIASLVLGIISVLLFCTCINLITGILAIIFGILQLVMSRQKGLAVGGIVTAGISILFTVILYLSMAVSGAAYDGYNDYNKNFYDDYQSYFDDYYDNYDGYGNYDYGSSWKTT